VGEEPTPQMVDAAYRAWLAISDEARAKGNDGLTAHTVLPAILKAAMDRYDPAWVEELAASWEAEAGRRVQRDNEADGIAAVVLSGCAAELRARAKIGERG